MATFSADGIRVNIELYQKKLELLKEEKLRNFDLTEQSSPNFTEKRRVYCSKLEHLIEKRLLDAREKAKIVLEPRLNSKNSKATAYDPYELLGLDGGKLTNKQEYLESVKNKTGNNLAQASDSQDPYMEDGKLDWSKLYENPNIPLVVDAGCGSGKFLMRFAWEGENGNSTFAKMNFLGIEIRKGLVDQAMQDRTKLGYQGNVYYLHTEFDEEFVMKQLKYYPGTIEMFCCQMPDPRFKKNMKRRGKKKLTTQRIIRKSLVEALGSVLDPAKGIIYISSEYEEVMLQMNQCILSDNSHYFRLATVEEIERLYFGQSTNYDKVSEKNLFPNNLVSNPFGCETERELFLRANRQDSMIYRLVAHVKSKQECNNVSDSATAGSILQVANIQLND